jgi:hypothetical protein
LRLWTFLVCGVGDMPEEYLSYILCTELYHCPPSAVEDEDWGIVLRHLVCRDVEIKLQNMRMHRR